MTLLKIGGWDVTDVVVGAVYERPDAPHLRCVVEAIKLVGGVPHAYLRSLGDRTDVRLLSVSALANENEFRRVSAKDSAAPV